MIVALPEARKGYQPFVKRPLTSKRSAVSLRPPAITGQKLTEIASDCQDKRFEISNLKFQIYFSFYPVYPVHPV